MRRRTTLTVLAAAALCAVLPGEAAAADGASTLTLGGKKCNLIEVPTAAPIGVGRCPGVRPGALVETPVGFCTMNFLFRDGRGNRYIGTAGHCILNRNGEREYNGGGPIAKDGQGRAIGRFRYAVLRGEKDFALIELNQRGSNRAKPRMCHFGGPTGVDTSRPRRTITLQHYGQGIVTGNLTPARTFLANGMPNRNHVFAKGVVAPGDSGGPVTRRGSGRAVGLVVTVGVHFGGSLLDNGT
ncbi:MAG: hypothetical protein H0V08_05545, partial [Thermoleophilaceae bacterium]|nr:hypothetical protein [Thermoleophilaceae bacterium]